MPSILFICTANQFRSPLAAAYLSRLIAQEDATRAWKIESAGTWATDGSRAPAMTEETARSLGLPGLQGHLTRQVDRELLAQFDLVIVMEQGHKEALCAEFPAACRKISLLAEIVDGVPYDIPDPGKGQAAPAETGSILADLLRRGKEKILASAESLSKE